MNPGDRSQYRERDDILDLLSDEEVAKVSAEEGRADLADGDEYIDLERLDDGVRQHHGPPVASGRVLPRKAVRDATWSRILGRLGQAAGR